MGLSKWLKNMLGGKKEKVQNNVSIYVDNKKDRKRWSFGKSEKNFSRLSEENAERLRSYYRENDQEQSKHTIAVAEATAAAADAAAAAALAAAAVVKLTSTRKPAFNNSRETWAAVKIQTVFRGFLARKAHRALRGLVKLQALVRGYLIRKQAAATFHNMQSLIRAQATVRTQKARSLLKKDPRFQSESRPRKSMEISDDYRNEIMTSIHSRRMSGSIDNIINVSEDNPKIVEVDTCRPKSTKSRRMNILISDSCEDMMILSPIPSSQIPSYLTIPDCPNTQEFDWGLIGDEHKFSTAQSTPRFASNPSCTNGGIGVLTPAKSVGRSNFFRRSSNFPNYMTNTQSSIAKVRSQSAPKQRPEPGSKRRLSLREIADSRSSFTGIRMHRSTSHDQELCNFKHSIVGRLDRSTEFIRDADRDYLHRRW